MSDRRIEPCLLGAYGENDALFGKLVTEFLCAPVFRRRDFHPELPPPIATRARYAPEYEAFVGRMRRELHALSRALEVRLEGRLEGFLAVRAPVVALVGMLGTTEFGTLDPVDALVDGEAWR